MVEIVKIRVNYATFYNWQKNCGIKSNLNPVSFNTYAMFYMLTAFRYKKSYIFKKVKRTIVVLKSPFHYKTPKHHLQYKFYITSHTIIFKKKFYKRIRFILSNYFVQNKALRMRSYIPYSLKLNI